jgi:hypothetical protein
VLFTIGQQLIGLYLGQSRATLGDPGMPWSWEGYTPYDQARAVTK